MGFIGHYKLLLELWTVRMLHRALASTEATPLEWIRQLEGTPTSLLLLERTQGFASPEAR